MRSRGGARGFLRQRTQFPNPTESRSHESRSQIPNPVPYNAPVPDAPSRRLRAPLRGGARRRLHRHARIRDDRHGRRQPAPQTDLRLRERRRPKPTSGRSIPSASSIRRRASRSSSGSRPTARSPTTCCVCAAPTQTAVWVELTARGRAVADGRLRVEALLRDVSERKKLDDRDARHLSPAAAGGKDGGARPDDLRRRARAEQPARHDPELGRTARRSERARRDRSGAASRPSSASRSARPESSATCSPSRASGRRRARWWTSIRSCARRWRCAPTSSASPTSPSSTRSPPGLPQVFADGHQVQQVLLNLVINAEQAMLSANGRGVLVVRTWHDARAGVRSSSRSTTMARAFRTTCSRRSSTRSSRRRRSARAPGSA